jgi:hypothetical protein
MLLVVFVILFFMGLVGLCAGLCGPYLLNPRIH